MTTDIETPRIRGFVPSILPWLLGGAMLAVFLATMNHGASLYNLGEVVDLANWSQSAHAFGPVTYLVTYPMRWLPVSWMPVVLNLFSAVCGALTLCLLARSVSLLPHDRTHDQRQREQSEFSILTIPAAWLPPLFAVLICGLQMTFWENAAHGTSELFDLLLFAYVIRCLLEFRISRKESWLVRFALVYGLAMANNWAMIGFFPAFLTAVIWIKGLEFFDLRFILRTAALGLAGFSLILLLPLLNQFSHTLPMNFWEMLRGTLSAEKLNLSFFFRHREIVGVMALTSILPVLVMGIRWSSYFGDNSALGIFLAKSMFHVVHGVILLVCLWVALDSQISPRQMGFGSPFLTFYYLGALAIGYLSGYFLLVFGPTKSRRQPNPLEDFLGLAVRAGIWVLFLAVSAVMVGKNLPQLRTNQLAHRMFDNYFLQLEKSLPSKGAVVLSDDPVRLHYFHLMLECHGQHTSDLLVDTAALEDKPGYLHFLEKANPGYQLSGPWTNIPPTAPRVLAEFQLLEHLAKDHAIYYLHPSFGYYFERYYLEPHGLVYQMKPYEPGAWDASPPSQELINENETFWKEAFHGVLPPLLDLLKKSSAPSEASFWQTLLTTLHLKTDEDKLTPGVGAYYARSIDEWGVDLAMAGHRSEAITCFDQALQLYPGSLAAHVNKAFAEAMAAGKRPVIQSGKEVEKSLEKYDGNWIKLLKFDGPIDEPSFRDDLAGFLAAGYNYRQAAQQLNRIRALVPDDPRVPLQQAKLYLHIQAYSNGLARFLPYQECYSMAMSNINAVLKQYPNEPSALFLKSYALMQRKAYDQAIEPLNHILSQPSQTNNYAAQLNRAIAHYKVGNYNAAKSDYEALSRVAPNAYQIYYGLAEIAYHQKDMPSAIKNYELYLTNAPPNTAEAKGVTARLKELKSGAP